MHMDEYNLLRTLLNNSHGDLDTPNKEETDKELNDGQACEDDTTSQKGVGLVTILIKKRVGRRWLNYQAVLQLIVLIPAKIASYKQ